MLNELKNFLSKNRTTLLILMLSMVVLMVLPAVILKHCFHQNLKNWQVLLTPLITIVLYVSGLSKLDEWMSTKKKNTCIELMELISKQNNIFRKIEEIYKFDLVANEWTVIEKEDSNSDFNTAFDELMNERFDVNMDIKEKIKTLKILNVKLDDVIDEVLFWNEDMASKFDEWNLKRNKNFDPYGEFPITMYNYYIDELRSSIRTNKELQIKYTQKDFNKLFTIN